MTTLSAGNLKQIAQFHIEEQEEFFFEWFQENFYEILKIRW